MSSGICDTMAEPRLSSLWQSYLLPEEDSDLQHLPATEKEATLGSSPLQASGEEPALWLRFVNSFAPSV